MATLTLFKSKAPVMGYAFRSGKVIHFVAGLYATSIPSEITELTEVCQDSPTFYIDSDQKEIAEEAMNPVAVLKAQLRAEILAEQLAATGDVNRNLGTTDGSGKLGNITTSATLLGAAVQSGTAQTGTPVLSVKADLKASAALVSTTE